MPERHAVLAGRVRVRLVVQRALRPVAAAVRDQCAAVPTAEGEPHAAPSHHHQAAGRRHFYIEALESHLPISIISTFS